MRADPTEMLHRARVIRDRAEAEREKVIILRESTATLLRMARDVREAISRQLTEARQSSDERSVFQFGPERVELSLKLGDAGELNS